MKWKTLTVPEASKEVQEMKDDIFSVADGLTEEDLAIQKKLRQLWQDTKQELASEEGKIKYNYNRDLVFALKIYEFFSVGQYNMPPRIAADPRVWSYISIRLVPEIVRERWPKKSSWEDRFYRKPNRIYLKVLWWYIYLSWQGETEDTRIILENNTEDTIAQLVERSGAHGYRLELYRKIMRHFFMMDDNKCDMMKFRKIMKLHTARIVSIEPEMMVGGIPAYIEELLEYFDENK